MRTIAQFAIRNPEGEDEYGKRRGSVVRQSFSTVHSQSGSKGQGSLLSNPVAPQQILQAHGSVSSHHSTQSRSSGSSYIPDLPSGPSGVLPQNELHTDVPNAYSTSLFPELPTDYEQETPTASRRTSVTERGYNVHELAASQEPQTHYSPIDAAGPFGDGTQSSFYAQPHQGGSNPALAQAAQNLPGSLLPPMAIAEMRGEHVNPHTYASGPAQHELSTHRDSSDDEAMPPPDRAPPLPSYANKPYLSMLTEDTGRGGRLASLPSSPTGGQSSPPTSPRVGQSSGQGPGPALRIANRDSTFVGMDEVDWPTEALMHMGIEHQIKRKDVPGSK